MSDDKERLAAWMMQQGFATGHGDTTEELLEELSWQVAEIKSQRGELIEALEEQADQYQYVNQFDDYYEKARAVIAKAKGDE